MPGLIIIGIIVFLIFLSNNRTSLIMSVGFCIASFVCAVNLFRGSDSITPVHYLVVTVLAIICFLGPTVFEKDQDGWEFDGRILRPNMIGGILSTTVTVSLIVIFFTVCLGGEFAWCYFILPVLNAIGLAIALPISFS